MDYRSVTNPDSAQYQLIYSDEITVGEDGLLHSGEYIGVALGTRYGNVGDKFIITLADGKQFKAIKLDVKSDAHTANGCHHLSDGSVVEFVIDRNLTKLYYPMADKMGNFDYEEQFSGAVIKIEKVIEK